MNESDKKLLDLFFETIKDYKNNIEAAERTFKYVLPKECLNSCKLFLKLNEMGLSRIEGERCFISTLKFATNKVKTDKEVAMTYALKNRSIAGLYSVETIQGDQEKIDQLRADREFIDTVADGSHLIVKSKLLEDPDFLRELVGNIKAKQTTDPNYKFNFDELAKYSKLYASSLESKKEKHKKKELKIKFEAVDAMAYGLEDN